MSSTETNVGLVETKVPAAPTETIGSELKRESEPKPSPVSDNFSFENFDGSFSPTFPFLGFNQTN